MTQLTPATLKAADLLDGREDGRLSQKQVQSLDPAFAAQVSTAQLFDDGAQLPYRRYLKVFEKGMTIWKGLAKDPTTIPLIDALILGKKTEEIQLKMDVGFRDQSLTPSSEITRRLKSVEELWSEVLGELAPYCGRREADQLEGARRVFVRELKKPGQSLQGKFEYAAKEALGFLAERGVFKANGGQIPGAILSKVSYLRFFGRSDSAEQASRAIQVYDVLSPERQENYIWEVSAALAYRSLYFFPAQDSVLWGGAILSVDLTYGPSSQNLLQEMFMPDDAFTASAIRGFTAGAYVPAQRRIKLPVYGLDGELRSGNNGQDVLLHELAHAVNRSSYPRTWREWAFDWIGDYSHQERLEAVQDFFSSLSLEEYRQVFGNTYGHPKDDHFGSGHYDPETELHSCLAELTERAWDFPTKIYDSLIAMQWTPKKAQAVYEQLTEFRTIIRETWGFKGPPEWASQAR